MTFSIPQKLNIFNFLYFLFKNKWDARRRDVPPLKIL